MHCTRVFCKTKNTAAMPQFKHRLSTSKLTTQQKQLAGAMRSAVYDQTAALKNRAMYVCELCGLQDADPAKFHVDHIKLFSQLKAEFMDMWSASRIPTKFNYESGPIYFKEVDAGFRAAWQQYHRDYATLRILCVRCNLKRSKK